MTGLSQCEESYNQELMNSKKLILDNQALKGRKGFLDKRIKMEINNLVQLENNLLRVYDETFKFQHEIGTKIEAGLAKK